MPFNFSATCACADKLADWAVAACRELSNLTYPGAAKALLSLALRGRSAAAAPPPGQAPMGGAVPKREPGCGDDLDLLLDLAADVKQMMNADGAQGLGVLARLGRCARPRLLMAAVPGTCPFL